MDVPEVFFTLVVREVEVTDFFTVSFVADFLSVLFDLDAAGRDGLLALLRAIGLRVAVLD